MNLSNDKLPTYPSKRSGRHGVRNKKDKVRESLVMKLERAQLSYYVAERPFI